MDLYSLCYPVCCAGGDFNIARNPNEKLGGRHFTTTMRKFDNIISELNLINPKLMDAKFTC